MALILAIEDNDDVLTLLSTVLRNHNVLLAPDSTSGLRMAKDMRPELILLDVGMPDVDGLEVCRALRRMPETARTPIILVTARWDVAENTSLLQSIGVTDAIVKPFSPGKLIARVDEALARSIGPAE